MLAAFPRKLSFTPPRPTKSIHHVSDLGIQVSGDVSMDLEKLQKWKSGIVSKLTGGVKQLLKGNGAEFAIGTASIAGQDSNCYRIEIAGKNKRTVTTKSVVLATGSRPVVIPGFEIDGETVIDSTGALSLKKLPKRLVVVGGGYIGLELGMVYAKLGSKVTVVEMLPALLSGMDPDCVAVVARKLKKMGVEVVLEAKAKSWEKEVRAGGHENRDQAG